MASPTFLRKLTTKVVEPTTFDVAVDLVSFNARSQCSIFLRPDARVHAAASPCYMRLAREHWSLPLYRLKLIFGHKFGTGKQGKTGKLRENPQFNRQ